MAFASPIPEEGMEAPEAVAYVHDPTGDVMVDDSPAALLYVHDAIGDVAVPYGAYPYFAAGDVAVAPKVEVKAAVVPLRRGRRGTQTLKKLNELLTLVREIHSHLI